MEKDYTEVAFLVLTKKQTGIHRNTTDLGK